MKWRYEVAKIVNLKAKIFIFAANIYHLPISVGLLDYHIKPYQVICCYEIQYCVSHLKVNSSKPVLLSLVKWVSGTFCLLAAFVEVGMNPAVRCRPNQLLRNPFRGSGLDAVSIDYSCGSVVVGM